MFSRSCYICKFPHAIVSLLKLVSVDVLWSGVGLEYGLGVFSGFWVVTLMYTQVWPLSRYVRFFYKGKGVASRMLARTEAIGDVSPDSQFPVVTWSQNLKTKKEDIGTHRGLGRV